MITCIVKVFVLFSYLVSGHETQPYSGSSIDELCCFCWMALSHGQSLRLFMIVMWPLLATLFKNSCSLFSYL